MIPEYPKIFHIVHLDRLPSILETDGLLSDASICAAHMPGQVIGMNKIKRRRLEELCLPSYPDLKVGECVPFYFCPRSVMLYVIAQKDHPELQYRGGQEPIVHLQADLRASVRWANQNGKRWVFTLSNAGSRYFEDRTDLAQLGDLDWDAIRSKQWANCKEGKQAEFLTEAFFPWSLVEEIGVYSLQVKNRVEKILKGAGQQTKVEVRSDWYY